VVVRELGASVHGGVRKPDSVCVTFTQVDRAQGSQGGPEHGRMRAGPGHVTPEAQEGGPIALVRDVRKPVRVRSMAVRPAL
jgi:hypothetical protein